MATDLNKETVRRWFTESWAGGDVELLQELAGDGYIRHTPEGTEAVSAEEHVATVRSAIERSGVPDNSVHFLGEGDEVAARLTMQWPDGETVLVIQLFRLEGGRIAETWWKPPVTGRKDW